VPPAERGNAVKPTDLVESHAVTPSGSMRAGSLESARTVSELPNQWRSTPWMQLALSKPRCLP